jgi:hypothetical protein
LVSVAETNLLLKDKCNVDTVKDIKELILVNAKSKDPQLRAHAETLFGPRTRGSTTSIALMDVPDWVPLEEVENHPDVNPGCFLFRFSHEVGGVLGALPFSHLYCRGAEIKVQQGAHGLELVTEKRDWQSESVKCNQIYVICGHHAGEFAVFTWHPGEPLGTLDKGICARTAVKLM